MKRLQTTIALPLVLIALTLVHSSRPAESASTSAEQHVMLRPDEIKWKAFPALGPAFSWRFYRAILSSQARPLCSASRCPMARKFLRTRNHAGRDSASRRLSETKRSRQSTGSFRRDDRRYARHTPWSRASQTISLEAIKCE